MSLQGTVERFEESLCQAVGQISLNMCEGISQQGYAKNNASIQITQKRSSTQYHIFDKFTEANATGDNHKYFSHILFPSLMGWDTNSSYTFVVKVTGILQMWEAQDRSLGRTLVEVYDHQWASIGRNTSNNDETEHPSIEGQGGAYLQ